MDPTPLADCQAKLRETTTSLERCRELQLTQLPALAPAGRTVVPAAQAGGSCRINWERDVLTQAAALQSAKLRKAYAKAGIPEAELCAREDLAYHGIAETTLTEDEVLAIARDPTLTVAQVRQQLLAVRKPPKKLTKREREEILREGTAEDLHDMFAREREELGLVPEEDRPPAPARKRARKRARKSPPGAVIF